MGAESNATIQGQHQSCEMEVEENHPFQANTTKVRLLYMTIRGFKSFRQKTKIGPFSNFSCIVGPNGAGKSVIGEALGFLLGCSAKTMRATCLSALLNEDMRSSGAQISAKVSLTLEIPDIGHMKISRTITRSISIYHVKSGCIKKQVSSSEIKQQLLSLGIATDIMERFIVMQSRQAVKAKQPLELCEYLEVVFGCSHFKGMIKEIEDVISQKTSESNIQQERLLKVQSQLDILQPEVKKWQSFDIRWRDFQKRKVAYLEFQQTHLKFKLEENVAEQEKMTVALNNVKKKKEFLQEQLLSLNVQACNLKSLVEEKNSTMRSTERKLSDMRTKMLKTQVKVDTLRKDLEMLKKEHMTIYQEKSEIDSELASFDNKLEKTKEKKANLQQHRISLNQEKLMKFSLKGSNAVAVEDDLREKRAKVKVMEEEMERHALQASRVREEVSLLEKEVNEIISEKKNQQQDIESLKEALQLTVSESNNIASCIIPDLKSAFQKAEMELCTLRVKIQSSEEKVNRISKEDQAAELLKVKLKQGFHGRLIDLAEVNNNVGIAVNAVMSNVVNTSRTFVVDNRNDAAEVIHHYSIHKIGVVTCEILSESTELDQRILTNTKNDCEQHVINFINCADVYKPIFWKYTKDWIIVKDNDTAIAYFKKKTNTLQKNLVTLKGDIFRQDGEVVCSNKKLPRKYSLKHCSDSHGIEQADNQLSIKFQEDRLNFLAHQSRELKEKILRQEYRLSMLHRREREIQSCLRKLQEGSNVDCLSLSKTRMTDKKRNLCDLNSKMESLQHELKHLREVIVSLEHLSNANVSEEIRDWRKMLHSVEEDIKRCDRDIEELGSNISCLLSKQKKIERYGSAISNKEKKLVEEQQEHAHIKDHLEGIQVQRNEIASEVEKVSCSLQELGKREEKLMKKIKAVDKEEHEIQSKLDRSCKVVSELRNKLNRIIDAFPKDSKDILAKRIDFDIKGLMDFKHRMQEDTDADENGIALAEEEEALKELHRTINPRALDDDLNWRKEEHNLIKEIKDLEIVLNTLKMKKESSENDRYEIFTASIKKVNSGLTCTYGELTKNGDACLSYTEDKTLLFTEGVYFLVRPGCHKWCNFSSLSGGQQALAALALSFSLQLEFPSPFYFFDEIDAALDTKNVLALANYVKTRTHAQYVVVSHRPQLYEQAPTIIGVYHYCGNSTAICSDIF